MQKSFTNALKMLKFWTNNTHLSIWNNIQILPESEQGWHNHRKNIKKERESWACTEFSTEINKLQSLKKTFTSHKYEVFSDQFHWPKILCNSVSRIYHMDFSENFTTLYCKTNRLLYLAIWICLSSFRWYEACFHLHSCCS